MEIKCETIAEAHELVVASIMKNNIEEPIETSPGKFELTMEYPELITTVIENPTKSPQVSEACNFGPGFIAQYKHDLCHLKLRYEYKEGMAPVYTYPWRLFDYPCYDDRSDATYGDGYGEGINQIAQIIKRLKRNRNSRRANAITWVPEIDGEGIMDQPCLQVVHFLIRNNTLHLRAFFRSHDMLGGAGANWVGLTGLMELVRDAVDPSIKIGTLTTCSSSAHIYWVRDKKDLDDFKKLLFTKYHMFV